MEFVIVRPAKSSEANEAQMLAKKKEGTNTHPLPLQIDIEEVHATKSSAPIKLSH